MSDILFCKGGTPKSPKSNTMKEFAQDLGPYKFQDAAVKELKGLMAEGSLQQFIDFFDKCQEHNVHIVGSNNTVSRSSQISLLIGLAKKGDTFVTKAVTKSLGLRDAIIVLIYSVSIASLASIFPSFRASRVDPVEALRAL